MIPLKGIIALLAALGIVALSLPEIVVAYHRIVIWRTVYPLMQVGRLNDDGVRVPMDCVNEPVNSQLFQQKVQWALAEYEVSNMRTPSLMRLVGQLYCQIGDEIKARHTFERLWQLVPGDQLTALQLLALYQKSGDKAALQALLSVRAVPTRDLLLVVDTFIDRGQFDLALTWNRFILQVDPQSADAWIRWRVIGIWHEENKDWQKAIDVYESALVAQEEASVGILRASFFYRIGIALERMDDPQRNEEAGSYYDQAIADGRFPNPGEYASAYERRGNWRRARRAVYALDLYLADYHQAVAIDPKSVGSILMIGRVYLEEYKNASQAQVYFEQALALSSKNASIWYYLGIAFAEQENWDGAVQAFRSALDLRPDWTNASERLKAARKRLDESSSP